MQESITKAITTSEAFCRHGARMALVALALTLTAGCENSPLAPRSSPAAPIPPTAPASPIPQATRVILLSVSTSGTNPDSDGYLLSMDFDTARHVASNDTLSRMDVSRNLYHWFTLTGIAPNCAADSESVSIPPEAAQTLNVNFNVSCIGPSTPSGSLGTRLLFVRRGTIYRATIGDPGATPLATGDDPSWSPNATEIVFVRADGAYVMSADGTNQRLIVRIDPKSYTGTRLQPSWSPDGKHITLYPDTGLLEVAVDSDGSNPPVSGGTWPEQGPPSWSPDGQHVALTDWSGGMGFMTWISVADVSGSTVSNIRQFDFYAGEPAWAPDGNNVVFVSSDGHVTVAGIDRSNPHVIATSRGPSRPVWSPDAKMIAYANTCVDYNCPSAILYASVDGTQHGVLIDDAHSPSWHK